MYTILSLTGKKHVVRNPEGVTKENIVQILTKEGQRRFSDLRSDLGITKAMLARHLDTLTEEGRVSSNRIGREVFYFLTEAEWERSETKINLFSSSLQSFINGEITGWKPDEEMLQKLSDKDFVKTLSTKLGALALFTIIKSNETQEKWYEATNEYVQQLSYGGIVFRRLVYPKPGLVAKDELKAHPEVQARVNRLYKAMRELYPREMRVMEQVCKDPKVLKDPDTGKEIFHYEAPPVVFELPKESRSLRLKINKTARSDESD